jgi:transcriptional regulator with XRE-family HTH domain
LGWSQRALAEALGLHETRVRRWARGLIPVPAEVADWLETLAAVHVQHPVPAGWAQDAA